MLQATSGCNSGSIPGGTGGGNTSLAGVGFAPGFGSPSAAQTTAQTGGNSQTSGFTPGFGAAPDGANTSVSTTFGFTPGFGSPPGGSGHTGTGSSGGRPGGGSTPGGGSIGSGVSGSTPLSDLTDTEAEQLCDAIDRAAANQLSDEQSIEIACTLTALSASLSTDANGQPILDAARCEAAVDDCRLTAEPNDEGPCDPIDIQQNSQGCDVTVAEYEACLSASIARAQQLANTFTCAALSNPQTLSTALADVQRPIAQCAAADACPGLGGSTDTGGTGGGTAGTGTSGSGGTAGIGSAGAGGSGGTGGGTSEPGCEETCRDSNDGWCDDGGPGADTGICSLGTDCIDCGPR